MAKLDLPEAITALLFDLDGVLTKTAAVHDKAWKQMFDAFLEQREKILPWIEEYSPYALVTPDDPPIYMFFRTPPAMGKPEKDPTHTANFGVKLEEHLRDAKVACELVYPGAPNVKHPEVQLQDGPHRGTYLAHEASGAEREEWWARAVQAFPDYAEYQKRTERQIPVVVLEPKP